MVCTVGTLLSPLTAARGGAVAFFILRFIVGIGWGVMYPCIGAVVAKWFHPNEKSSVIAIYTGGTQIASVIGLPLFAWLCTQKQIGGWPSIFYISGIIPIFWMLIWQIVVTNSPASNRFISETEQNYLETALNSKNSTVTRKQATNVTPWKKMAVSSALWSATLSYFAASILIGTLQTYMPSYFKTVLRLNLKDNGFYSALPYVCQWLTKFITSPISDRMKSRTNMDHTKICKIFNTIGSYGCATFLVTLSFVDCEHRALALISMSLIFTSFGCFIPGFRTALLSIAPVYSGTIVSLTKAASDGALIIAPVMVGGIAPQGTRHEWQIVYGILAVILVLAGTVFLVFGSSEVQTWAIITAEQGETKTMTHLETDNSEQPVKF